MKLRTPFLLASFLLLSFCGQREPPVVTPPTPDTAVLTVAVFHGLPIDDNKIPQARVDVDGSEHVADGSGNVTIQHPVGKATIVVRADGYEDWGPFQFDVPYLLGDVQASLSQLARPPPPVVSPPAKPPTPQGPQNIRGRIIARGRAFLYSDGSPWQWRGSTEFALLDQVADGREHEARSKLKSIRAAGFTLARVLCMASGLFQLSPDQGQAHLQRLLEIAREEDVYLELTALADTKAYNMPDSAFRQHVSAVGSGCANSWACAGVELVNESKPIHPTQDSRLDSVAYLESLRSLIPSDVPVSLGSTHAESDEDLAYANGDYLTVHLDRGRDSHLPIPWNQIRRVREIENVSAATKKPAVNDEAIGFDETWQPGRRLTDPTAAYLQGVLGRIFNVPTTLHSQAGLYSQPFGPKQQAAAEAFIAGTRIAPDDVRLTFKNSTWADSPVKSANFTSGVVRIYHGVSGNRGWSVALGVTGDPQIVWQNGWRIVHTVYQQSGAIVWEIAQ